MSMHKGLIGKTEGGGSVGFDRMPNVKTPANVPDSRTEQTLGEYVRRKNYHEAFDRVAEENNLKKTQEYLNTINHPQFKEASLLVYEAEMCLKAMGMSKEEARRWLMAWCSGAGDGSE